MASSYCSEEYFSHHIVDREHLPVLLFRLEHDGSRNDGIQPTPGFQPRQGMFAQEPREPIDRVSMEWHLDKQNRHPTGFISFGNVGDMGDNYGLSSYLGWASRSAETTEYTTIRHLDPSSRS